VIFISVQTSIIIKSILKTEKLQAHTRVSVFLHLIETVMISVIIEK